MTAKKYFAITLILLAMIAMMFAIVISMQGEETHADGTYTITWLDWDGSPIGESEVPEGEVPTRDEPQRAATAKYTYTFTGWDPAPIAATENATYTATYNQVVNEYTITWKNYDGTTLATDSVAYDETPTYSGVTPTKSSTIDKVYSFSGWSPEIVAVTGDATYTATYEESEREYTITWKNYNNEILGTDSVAYGSTPTYTGATPTKDQDNLFVYTFDSWSPAIENVTGDATYTATFTSEDRLYTIKWIADGVELKSVQQKYDTDIPEFGQADPTKAADEYNTYSFSVWSKSPQEATKVTSDITYTAIFTSETRYYDIKWVNYDGTELKTMSLSYGQAIPEYDGETPTKESTAQYSYTFKAWDPSVSATVVGDAIYKATYDSEIRTYTITWVDENGDELEIDDDVKYGVTPTFDQANPTKDETKQYKYAFDGWSPEVTEVTGDATYTATYKATVQSYTVTWVNYDGDELEVDENVLYGEMPVYTGDIPTKPSDVRYDYTFSSWDKDLEPIDGDITYMAIFSHTYIEYTITYTSGVGYSITVTNNGDAITSGSTVTYDDTVVVSYVINAGYDDNNDFEIIGVNDTAYTRVDNTLTNIHTYISISVSATAKNYVITFKQDGINPMPQTTYQIVYAQKVTLPTATKDGHTFVCWLHNDEPYTDATGAMLEAYNFTGGITLEARFSANRYIITYDEYTDKESDEVTYGTTFTLEIPIRPGYVFEGWYYNATQITDIEGDSITAYLYAEDIEAESKWTEITIVLNNDALRHTYRYGKPFEVVATVTPQNASTVTYSVSTEGVISLGQDGNYTIIGIGQTVLRATLDNGGAYKECPISVSDIFINDDYSSFNYLYITINGEEYGRKHAVICEDNTKMSTISKEILEYLNIPNAYVDRTDIGIELDPDAKFKDVFSEGDTLNINLVYNIEKATNTHVSYRLSANTAEFGQKVYLEDLIAKEGYKLGNIIVTNEKDLDVEISQLERSFVMPGANVLVDVLLKSVEVESSTINNISIKSDIGIKSNAKFVVNEIDKNTYNQNITFSDRKQVVYAMHVDYIEGEQSLDYTDKYTIVMNVPKEFIGKDGMEVMYFQNGETIVKQIYIEGDTLTLTLAGAGDIVFVSNIHGSTVYLYWLIIIMLFVDALLGMIFIILFINYQDALQRRRELNGYSTVLPVLLLGAAIASEVAFLVFLGILFLVELIGIAWLALKLTNKYFIYTTYHKMTYVKPQDYNSVVKDIKDRQQNE